MAWKGSLEMGDVKAKVVLTNFIRKKVNHGTVTNKCNHKLIRVYNFLIKIKHYLVVNAYIFNKVI